MALELRTTALTPLSTVEKRLRKLARKVSLTVSVPDRNPTPMKTARNVPSRRRLWPQTLLTVALNTARPLPRRDGPRRPLLSHGLQIVENLAGGGGLGGNHEQAVGEEQHPGRAGSPHPGGGHPHDRHC